MKRILRCELFESCKVSKHILCKVCYDCYNENSDDFAAEEKCNKCEHRCPACNGTCTECHALCDNRTEDYYNPARFI